MTDDTGKTIRGRKGTVFADLWNRRTMQTVGKQEVAATLYGDFAVHKSIPNGDCWVVTHRHSGLSLCRVDKLAEARAVARAVAEVAAPWTERTDFDPAVTRELWVRMQRVRGLPTNSGPY